MYKYQFEPVMVSVYKQVMVPAYFNFTRRQAEVFDFRSGAVKSQKSAEV